MLTQAYTAIEQFQRQISDVKTFQELKNIFTSSKANLIIQIGSSTFWQIDWNPIKGTISGVLEVSILPKILIAGKNLEARRSVTFRLEDPKELIIGKLQDQLISPIQKVLETAK